MSAFSQHGQLRWLAWLGIGAVLHLCAILLSWLLCRSIDLSLLNPLSYSDFGWLWLWVNE